MRQLIARIDDDLHRRLKQRAADEGRSMNAVVVDLLEGGLEKLDERARFLARLEALGLRVTPPPPSRVPSWDEVIEAGRGAGTAVSEALEAERGSR